MHIQLSVLVLLVPTLRQVLLYMQEAVPLIIKQIHVVAFQSAMLAQAAAEREALALQLLCYPLGPQ